MAVSGPRGPFVERRAERARGKERTRRPQRHKRREGLARATPAATSVATKIKKQSPTSWIQCSEKVFAKKAATLLDVGRSGFLFRLQFQQFSGSVGHGRKRSGVENRVFRKAYFGRLQFTLSTFFYILIKIFGKFAILDTGLKRSSSKFTEGTFGKVYIGTSFAAEREPNFGESYF